MFKFGGWKASLHLHIGSSRRKEVYENGPTLSVEGAYRTHREEFFGNNSTSETPRIITPSMVKLPPSNNQLKTSKSANDLTEPIEVPLQLRRSTNDVSTDPRGGTSSNRNSSALHRNEQKANKDKKKEKEQKNAEKKRLAEQKKQEKLAMQQAKKDKLRMQQEKKIAERQAREKAKKQGPLPQTSVTKPQTSVTKPQAPKPAQRSNPLAYSTNTLESSISRTSGPPPYSEPKPPEKQINDKDTTGNTSFSKPIENSSWDLISDHRSQMSRNPVASGGKSKQMVMDLQFNFDRAQRDDMNNSEV